jgi:hypothetical protein
MSRLGKRGWTGAVIVASVCVVVGAAAVASSKPASDGEVRAAASGVQVQPGLFSAYIRRGPDRGLAVWGVLSGKITSAGKIRATLTGDRPRTRVTGSVTGRRARLDFHLPGGRVLTGVGRAGTTIRDFKSIPTEGTFSGPRRGDRGVWDIVHCTESRPGLPGPRRFRCVTSEGKVFYVEVPA